MKESLFDIFNSQRHSNWMEFNEGRELEEMRQEAALYADSLLPLADRWQKAVEYDVTRIATTEPPHTHFNQDRARKYSVGVDCFLSKVAAALRNHGFDIGELDRVTQWRLGQQGRGTKIEESLSRDEANQLFNQLKKQGFIVHCFRELCTNEYTVLSYKVEASQTMPPQGETPPPPARQEPKTPKQPGAKKTAFIDFVEGIDDEDCENMIETLHKYIDNKQPAQAALIIAAAIEADWISIKVTAPSIEREFGISEASIKPHLSKYRARRDETTPYYTRKELQPYIDIFKG